MNERSQDPSFTSRLSERPGIDPSALREIRARDLGFRFAAGAITSIAAGLLTLALGTRVGGTLLAFPAILLASLTLIEQEDDSLQAREDARGAVLGGCAMALFAAVAAVMFVHAGALVALLAATAAWLLGAVAGYVILWLR